NRHPEPRRFGRACVRSPPYGVRPAQLQVSTPDHRRIPERIACIDPMPFAETLSVSTPGEAVEPATLVRRGCTRQYPRAPRAATPHALVRDEYCSSFRTR